MIDHRISHWIIGLLLFGACHDPVLVSDSEEDLSSLQDTITLIFGGDIMCHKPQVTSAQKDSTYDFSGVFQYVEPIISEADIGFVNLETTLSSTGPYTGYPGFKSPDELVHAVSEAGFDVVVTANNHSNDTRAKGLIHTIDVLRSLGLYHTGTFIDSLDKALNYPLMIKHEGISIALLNYTYSTNGVPTTTPTLVNVIDSTQLKSDIRLAKSHHPDLIIAFMHWGSQ